MKISYIIYPLTPLKHLVKVKIKPFWLSTYTTKKKCLQYRRSNGKNIIGIKILSINSFKILNKSKRKL